MNNNFRKGYNCLNINNYITNEKIMKYWCSQKSDWSCGIAASKSILKYLDVTISEKSLITILKKMDLKIFNFGILTPYIPLLFLKLNFKIKYRTNTQYFKNLKNLKINGKRDLRNYLENITLNTKKKNLDYYLYYSLLKILDCEGKIVIYKKRNYPNAIHIFKNLKNNHPIIVGISSKDYYKQINENWDHTLAFIPQRNKYWIQDPYETKGLNEYNLWQKYLSNSRYYNWNLWSDELIEIYPLS